MVAGIDEVVSVSLDSVWVTGEPSVELVEDSPAVPVRGDSEVASLSAR